MFASLFHYLFTTPSISTKYNCSSTEILGPSTQISGRATVTVLQLSFNELQLQFSFRDFDMN